MTKRGFFFRESRQPNWGVMSIEGIENLLALQWKLLNIQKNERKETWRVAGQT
jgi:hypothetical protein